MKWRARQGSRNIQRRGRGKGGKAVGGIGGIGAVVVLLVGWYFGVDVSPLLNGATQGGTTTVQTDRIDAQNPEIEQFVSVVLADTEIIWAEVFDRQVDGDYTPLTLVLFEGQTQSACGGASAAAGPFYCPPEQMVYLDTDFFNALQRKLGAGGDFAQAYVIAHEVAHHVQNQLGILRQVNQMRARVDEVQSNALSVRVELQADCYAGIWANLVDRKFDVIERGDIAEAMNAAAQIGDDTLQRNAGMTVNPESFSHGTSAQRQRWFDRGYASADLTACDTFSADRL